MFGNTDNNTRSETEDIQSNGSCYGGFGRRFSYEQSKKDNGGFRITTSGLVSAICALVVVGAVGALCGVVMYHMVEANKPLYYPSGDLADSDRGKSGAAYKEADVVMPLSEDEGIYENVTSDLSARYRVPTGVMIKRVAEDSEEYAAGLRSGDILISIDGIKVSDIDTMNGILSSREASMGSEIMIFRNNVYIVLNIED